ncbi:hypothetical protein [Candidatus Pelagibacter bacterium nBUS_25]|uniref:hypothetical protein n=1 Tax=Candidatus Pelagibacter bacterium nBUS_25 TaxID=3374187 RepID=UPI003EB80741
MNSAVKKIILSSFVLIYVSSCSTAVTVVDTSTSAVINTTKGIIHYSTCPFTKKECF